jgi:hypothetical protein
LPTTLWKGKSQSLTDDDMDEFLQQEEEKAKELEEFRQIREMQDREYALSLAADREKAQRSLILRSVIHRQTEVLQ